MRRGASSLGLAVTMCLATACFRVGLPNDVCHGCDEPGDGSDAEGGGDVDGGDAPQPPTPMPVISRYAPAFASPSVYGPTFANDGDYATEWFSDGSLPAWLAYDLSGTTLEERARVVVAWYGDIHNACDITLFAGAGYGLPADYTIEAHAGVGGGSPPEDDDSQWVVLVDITGDVLSSRQFVLELIDGETTYNWLRLRVTDTNGDDIALNLDVHTAPPGALEDDWIFFGDIHTDMSMNHDPLDGSIFSELIQDRSPAHFPLQQVCGFGSGVPLDFFLPYFNDWLVLFPGKYVALAYGTYDIDVEAPTSGERNAFYGAYESIAQDIIQAGKVPVLATIAWQDDAAVQPSLLAYNEEIISLQQAYPEIIPGPDLYSVFLDHPELLQGDGVLLNDAGALVYRQAWAEAMAAAVYLVDE